MGRHLTPSMVVALTGTAIAAKRVLITGAQIKDHSIGYVDLSSLAVANLRLTSSSTSGETSKSSGRTPEMPFDVAKGK